MSYYDPQMSQPGYQAQVGYQAPVYQQQTMYQQPQSPTIYQQTTYNPAPVVLETTTTHVHTQSPSPSTVLIVDHYHGRPINHSCHFFLTLITLGLWTPFWVGACCGCCCQHPCGC